MKSKSNYGNDKNREYTISMTILQEDYEKVVKKCSHLKDLRYDYKIKDDNMVIVSIECNSTEDIDKLHELLKDLIIN